MTRKLRVPPPAASDIFGNSQEIQVNHCRMSAYENFDLFAKALAAEDRPIP